MIIPVATAQQFARGFRVTMVGAMVAGTWPRSSGVTISAFADVQPGATIVLVSLAGFALTFPIGLVVQRRRRALMPFPVTAEPAPARHGRRAARARARTRAAVIPRSSTATMSTTCTAATGTPYTEGTMTSTDPPPTAAGCGRPASAGAIGAAMETFEDFRSAQEIHALLAERGERVGLSTVYRTLQTPRRRRRDRRPAHRDRREHLPPVQRDPPPPPGLPPLRRDRRGRGPGGGEVDARRSPPPTATPTSATPSRSSAPAAPAADRVVRPGRRLVARRRHG